jgi:succinylarginine dihydrolase
MHQKEERSVIRFLSSEGVKPIEIHRQMKVHYGDACLSLQEVYERTRKFMNGIRFDEKLQQVLHDWLRSQPKESFSRGIHALPKCWNTCMERNGDYTER